MSSRQARQVADTPPSTTSVWPLQDRGRLFPEDVDTSDPWQFKNFRVV